MTQTITIYGIGGYDSTKPNNNIVEQYEVDIPDPEPTTEQLLQAQIDALIEIISKQK
jgi:hypothetical protein